MSITTKRIARAGVIGALYVMLSLLTFAFSSGTIQLRLAEGLCLLPLFFVEAIPALFVGCFLTNVIAGCAIIEAVFGALITLLCCVMTYIVGKFIKIEWLKLLLGGVFPVLLNAFLLPLLWYWCYGQMQFLYIAQVGILCLSQGLAVYGVGVPLYFAIKKLLEKQIL